MADSSEAALRALHTQVAVALSQALEVQELPGEVDEETGEVSVIKVPPSAAILQAAAKFLKDNNITCVPSKDNALGELEEKMRQRQARRSASKTDLAVAREDMGFMTGLPN